MPRDAGRVARLLWEVGLTISVVVVWRESAELLRRCLLAIAGQGADQVVVSRSSEAEYSDALRSEFPNVIWIAHEGTADLPELQWLALTEVDSDIVAYLEAPSAPGPGWIAAHRTAHEAHPEALSCGGPVRLPAGSDAWGKGWYWSDYAAYTPGRPSGQTRDLTDANVSYKTAALRANERLLSHGAWGWRIRQADAAMSYFESSAWIDFPCSYLARIALRQRWSAGHAHGAVQTTSRLRTILGAPLLPVVLAWRDWRQARRAGRGMTYLSAMPWSLVFHIWWTCGEVTGRLASRRSSY